jgi:hypothetical protein
MELPELRAEASYHDKRLFDWFGIVRFRESFFNLLKQSLRGIWPK